jgi:hypothetical protein
MGGGAGKGGAAGAGGAQGHVKCPSVVPKLGDACVGEGDCTFPTDPKVRALFACYLGHWVTITTAIDASSSPADCPTDRASLVGTKCDPFMSFQTACLYPDATLCTCGCRHPLSSTAPQDVWTCSVPKASPCNLPQPMEGDPCPEVGIACEPACCQATWACTAKGWHLMGVLCPP